MTNYGSKLFLTMQQEDSASMSAVDRILTKQRHWQEYQERSSASQKLISNGA